MTAGLELRNLSHAYGELRVVDDLTLDVANGEFVAVVGPSGCGKSTVLRVLSGLLAPQSGSVSVDGQDVVNQPGSVAYLPQKDSMLPWLRAFQNATVGAEISAADVEVVRAKAHSLFARFGLTGFESSWPDELSGGMRQRVAVLRTFLLPHPVLALDEPFGALDALTCRSMQQWLREVWLEDRRSTVLVTHDVEEALLLADRVIVMSHRPGRIIDEIAVDLGIDRGAGIETTSSFVELKRRILHALGW